jgi:hypothetical protein
MIPRSREVKKSPFFLCQAASNQMAPDLGTTTGRGIAILGASDVLVYGNYIETIKQYGMLLDWNGSSQRPTRVQLTANTVKNCPLISGNAVTLQRTTDCIFSDNVILDPASGDSCLEIADWQNLNDN